MERFLYRFSRSDFADKFILKGALMFTVWNVPERRATRDIDFMARYDNQVAAIQAVVQKVCEMKTIPDGLVFDPKTAASRKIKEDADYEGVRIKFTGFLERSRIPMQIDFGFGDVIYPKPKTIHYPAILDFPAPNLTGYTVESAIAEKFEAMIKFGLLNSRMKDFYDVWLLMRRFDFKGETLVEAIKRTFHHRKTALPKEIPLFADEIYDKKSDRQTLWKAFLTKNQIKHAPQTLGEIARTIEDFLSQPLTAIARERKFTAEWNAPGPWKIA
jgi:predicted nucleotidyltransferase component of viral defense system